MDFLEQLSPWICLASNKRNSIFGSDGMRQSNYRTAYYHALEAATVLAKKIVSHKRVTVQPSHL